MDNTVPRENQCYLRYVNGEYRMYKMVPVRYSRPSDEMIAYLLDKDADWRVLIRRLYAVLADISGAGELMGVDVAFCEAAFPQMPPTIKNREAVLDEVLEEIRRVKISETFRQTENTEPLADTRRGGTAWDSELTTIYDGDAYGDKT